MILYEIGIMDNGIGIDESTISKLLNRDSQITTKGTNNEIGTGLGLSLCKDLITKQGGEIRIVSKDGKGTLIVFTLPRVKDS